MTINHTNGKTDLVELPWDSRAFARSCWELTCTAETPPTAKELRALFIKKRAEVVTWRRNANGAFAPETLHQLGFRVADLQLCFSVPLKPRAVSSPHLRPYRSADASALNVIAAAAFEISRFSILPGVTAAAIGQRFANWSAQLVQEASDTCFVYELGNRVVGAFLSKKDTSGLNLALAAVALGTPPGIGPYLYREAFDCYARMGYRFGYAAISARNLPVLNLYAGLGARFTKATEILMWCREWERASDQAPQ